MNDTAIAHAKLAALRPRAKLRVIDMVEAAGLDVSDWSTSVRGPSGASANPKYCYEWAFVGDRCIVLNLWHDALMVEGESILHRANFRADADELDRLGRGNPWGRRARRMDDALRAAQTRDLPVRVVINAGQRRDRNDPSSRSSRVNARELDKKAWSLVDYDDATGAHLLVRGAPRAKFVDQFDLDALGGPGQRQPRTTSVFARNAKVRSHALQRAGGRCEYCGIDGFRLPDGALYLETHHILPLQEGGDDRPENVIALCPSHHREAHYGAARLMLRDHFSALVVGRRVPLVATAVPAPDAG